MRLTMSIGLLMALTSPGSAQQRGAQPALLPLMGCGVHGDVEVLCGTRQPEDLELTPDSKYLIATQFLNAGRGAPTGGGMALFDLARKSFSKMARTAMPDKSWGDPACTVGDALVSHGSSLAKRSNGAWELYVVNHGTRQSIEMYELKPASGSWALIWHGCVAGAHDYNVVAILLDGGFVRAYPTRLLSCGNTADQFGGGMMGYVARCDCPEGSGRPCIQGFAVAEINPATMQARTVFDSAAHDPLITGVSVALAVGDSIYLGAFQGDRLVKIAYQR